MVDIMQACFLLKVLSRIRGTTIEDGGHLYSKPRAFASVVDVP